MKNNQTLKVIINSLETVICMESRFSSDSEAFASELLEKHEDMFTRY